VFGFLSAEEGLQLNSSSDKAGAWKIFLEGCLLYFSGHRKDGIFITEQVSKAFY